MCVSCPIEQRETMSHSESVLLENDIPTRPGEATYRDINDPSILSNW
jgi:hypothetical protein